MFILVEIFRDYVISLCNIFLRNMKCLLLEKLIKDLYAQLCIADIL